MTEDDIRAIVRDEFEKLLCGAATKYVSDTLDMIIRGFDQTGSTPNRRGRITGSQKLRVVE